MTIERDTAITWGGRAAASYECSLEEGESDHAEAMRCFWEGETYRAEAVEHAAMTEDARFVERIASEVEEYRAEAREALVKAGHAFVEGSRTPKSSRGQRPPSAVPGLRRRGSVGLGPPRQPLSPGSRLVAACPAPSPARSTPRIPRSPCGSVLYDGNGMDGVEVPKLPPETLKRAFRTMLQVRTLDTRLTNLQRQGRIGFYGACTGQEADADRHGAWRCGAATGCSRPCARVAGCCTAASSSATTSRRCIGNDHDLQKGRQMPCHLRGPLRQPRLTGPPSSRTQLLQPPGPRTA